MDEKSRCSWAGSTPIYIDKRSRLQPMKDVAKTLLRYEKEMMFAPIPLFG